MFFKRWTDAFYKQHLLFLFSGLIASRCIVRKIARRSNQPNDLNGLWRQFFLVRLQSADLLLPDISRSEALYHTQFICHLTSFLLRPPHCDRFKLKFFNEMISCEVHDLKSIGFHNTALGKQIYFLLIVRLADFYDELKFNDGVIRNDSFPNCDPQLNHHNAPQAPNLAVTRSRSYRHFAKNCDIILEFF